MSVIDKVRALDAPHDQLVVIGSGLLDVWGFREASDVDLVVSNELYEKLSRDDRFVSGEKRGDRFLAWGEYEVFDNWGENASFSQLYAQSIVVDGVHFVAPDYLIAWKQQRNWEKDRRDITLLKERLRHDE